MCWSSPLLLRSRLQVLRKRNIETIPESRQQLYGVVAVEIMEANASARRQCYTQVTALGMRKRWMARGTKQNEDQQHVL